MVLLSCRLEINFPCVCAWSSVLLPWQWSSLGDHGKKNEVFFVNFSSLKKINFIRSVWVKYNIRDCGSNLYVGMRLVEMF